MIARIVLAYLLVVYPTFSGEALSKDREAPTETKVITERQLKKATAEIAEEAEKNEARFLVKSNAGSVALIYTISKSAEDNGMIYNSAVKRRLKKHHCKYCVTSGVILSQDGIICTTYNGIMNADDIIVSVNSETRKYVRDHQITIGQNEYRAKVVKLFPKINLAFLRITPRGDEKFQFMPLGNDAALINGQDRVLKNGSIVIGKAKGENFVTPARPANSRNNFDIYAALVEKLTYKKVDGKPILLMENSVISSGVVPENEGGAVIDLNGKLVGIAVISESDIVNAATTTAIPVSVVRHAARKVAPDTFARQDGEKLGLTVVDSNDIKIPKSVIKILRISGKYKTFGAKIDSIIPESVADSAGLQPGDIILKFNDDIIKDSKTYKNAEDHTLDKQSFTLKILRNDKLLDMEINW
ncbi:MAG: S1C family serine protease [Holosporales bacterium]|jgi:S1-C subfamily serine protease|nr:S1C family serine protease [Holosporales bacterium]